MSIKRHIMRIIKKDPGSVSFVKKSILEQGLENHPTFLLSIRMRCM